METALPLPRGPSLALRAHSEGGSPLFAGLGRRTSSPEQFGQTRSSSHAHTRQKVHSCVQMYASPSGGVAASHRWQVRFISSDTTYPFCFDHESRSVAVRLKTRLSGVDVSSSAK